MGAGVSPAVLDAVSSSPHFGLAVPRVEPEVCAPRSIDQGLVAGIQADATDIPQRWLVMASDVPSLPQLFERIYDRLHDLSSMHMRGQPAGHTLQATAVVHEAFLKLAQRDPGDFASEEHFTATAALVLRSVLVDHARRRTSAKRGRGRRGIDIADCEPSRPDDVAGILELEDALAALAGADDRSSRVAALRIFGAMEMAQIALVLGISVPTVERDWRFARAFLETQYHGAPQAKASDARVA